MTIEANACITFGVSLLALWNGRLGCALFASKSQRGESCSRRCATPGASICDGFPHYVVGKYFGLQSRTRREPLGVRDLGIVIFVGGFVLLDKMTPYDLWKEVCENKNLALAVLLGSMSIGLCIIIAAAVH